jgi:uncharacterized repeat protein (TIGR03803 family)
MRMLNNAKDRLVSALLVAGGVAVAGCSTNGGSSLAPLTRTVPAAGAVLPDAMRPGVQRLEASGALPWAGLINVGSLLYGTTQHGGSSDRGVVYKITTGGVEKPIHKFAGPPDGAYPTGPVLRVVACSCLYGTTQAGGTGNQGTIFAAKFAGGDNVLHNFVGSDGSDPEGRLIVVGPAVYGTTYSGGAHSVGTVFKITTSGSVLTTLHTFGATHTDGGFAYAGLLHVGSYLYGTTVGGGTDSLGTVFRIKPNGTSYRVLHSFSGGADGAMPYGNLIVDGGVLYGTTSQGGGAANVGTVFKITTGGVENVLHAFGVASDGAYPFGALVNVNGIYYGTTESGGSSGFGTVFSVTTGGSETVLYNFTGSPGDGRVAASTLHEIGTTLYGTTVYGGANDLGTVFKFATPSGPETPIYSF